MIYESLGIVCTAPIDGHNIAELRDVLSLAGKWTARRSCTWSRGKGRATSSPAAIPRRSTAPAYDIATGRALKKPGAPPATPRSSGAALADEAANDADVVAITAAMTGGTGLKTFAAEFPAFCGRGHRRGAGGGHGAGLSSGVARSPVVALYSTFMQRAVGSDDHRCGPAGGQRRVPLSTARAWWAMMGPRTTASSTWCIHAHGAEHVLGDEPGARARAAYGAGFGGRGGASALRMCRPHGARRGPAHWAKSAPPPSCCPPRASSAAWWTCWVTAGCRGHRCGGGLPFGGHGGGGRHRGRRRRGRAGVLARGATTPAVTLGIPALHRRALRRPRPECRRHRRYGARMSQPEKHLLGRQSAIAQVDKSIHRREPWRGLDVASSAPPRSRCQCSERPPSRMRVLLSCGRTGASSPNDTLLCQIP